MNMNRRWLELALKGLVLERNRIDEEIAEIKKELRTGSLKQPAELQESVDLSESVIGSVPLGGERFR
jgi:hypothetical protein